MFDTNVFPPQTPQQQQQASFPTFPDFTTFSQSTQLPLKPQVVHSNAPAGVQGVPSQPHQHQPVDNLFALFANDYGSNRGNECKTPNLNPLCMAPYSQPAQQPQAASARYGISGLSSNLTVPPTGVLNKHNALEITSTAGLNTKPQTGWGNSGIIPVSSHGTNHNPHFQRSTVGPIAPSRSSPTVMGITGNSGPVNSQSINSGRRVVSSSPSVQPGQGTSQQSGYATQQYSGGSGYRSYAGNNGPRGSVGFSSSRTASRGGVRGSGHSTRGALGGSYRNAGGGGGGGGARLNHSRSNYGNRGGASSGESISRRLPAENTHNDEDGENRTVSQSIVTLSSTSYTISTSSTTVSSPALTSTTCVTTTTNSVNSSMSVASSACTTATVSAAPVEKGEESTTEFETNLPIHANVCGDTSVEPSNTTLADGSHDVEIDGPTNAASSLSPSPDVSKSGQVENSVLLVDGASDKLESVNLTSVMQNTDSSQMPLSVATVKY